MYTTNNSQHIEDNALSQDSIIGNNSLSETDSILYNAYVSSEHPEIMKAFETIWVDFSKGKRSLKREKDTLLNFLCNMAMSFIYGKPVAISRKASSYPKGTRYSKLFFKYRRMVNLLDYMLDNGWIEVENKAWCGWHMGKGRTTTYKPSAKLIECFFKVDENNIDFKLDEVETVVLRKKINKHKSVDIDYMEWRLSSKQRQLVMDTRVFLKTYNLLMSDSCIIYTYTPKDKNKAFNTLSITKLFLPLEETGRIKCRIRNYLRRIFMKGDLQFRYGGRFYASSIVGPSYQRLSQEERQTITINGEPTVELDFACLHPRMLYARKNIQYDGDVYRNVFDDDSARCLAKTLVNADLNADKGKSPHKGVAKKIFEIRKRQWKEKELSEKGRSLLDAYEKYGTKGRELLSRFRKEHPMIAEFWGTGVGLELQLEESKIIMDVMKHFAAKGILCLPVHDSVIIAAQYENELREVMQEAYKLHTGGFECPVDNKTRKKSNVAYTSNLAHCSF